LLRQMRPTLLLIIVRCVVTSIKKKVTPTEKQQMGIKIFLGLGSCLTSHNVDLTLSSYRFHSDVM